MILPKSIVFSSLFAALLLAAAGPGSAQGKPSSRSNPAAGTGWIGVVLGNGPNRPAGPRDLVGGDQERSRPEVQVSRVVLDGPAMKSGLRAGDRILEVDGVPVESVSGLIAAVSSHDVGSWIGLKIERKGKRREIRVRLDGRPERVRSLRFREGYIGMKAIDLPGTLRTHFGAPEDAGVMISQVADGGPAYTAGMEPGDVVYEVDGIPVRSAAHLRSLVAGGGVENKLEIRLMRDGLEIVLEAKVEDIPDEVLEEREKNREDRLGGRSSGIRKHSPPENDRLER